VLKRKNPINPDTFMLQKACYSLNPSPLFYLRPGKQRQLVTGNLNNIGDPRDRTGVGLLHPEKVIY
jgi:hypothetical protein